MNRLTAFLAGLGVLTLAFAGFALALVLGAVAAVTLLVARLTGWKPKMTVRSDRFSTGPRGPVREERRVNDMRIWNDGRGTIIDMPSSRTPA